MENLVSFLKRMDYKYEFEGKSLKIYIDRSFVVLVNEKEDGVYSFTNSTASFNPLSGFAKQSLRQILIIHSVISILLFFGFQYLRYFGHKYDYEYVLIIYYALLFSWYFYYLVKFEILKSKIESLLNQ